MADQDERRFENVVQLPELAHFPERRAKGSQDIGKRSSGTHRTPKDGTRSPSDFTFSRETVQRLIDWIKEE